MLAFTDEQLNTMNAAVGLKPPQRSTFLQAVAARLELHRSFTDADVEAAVCGAARGLIYTEFKRRR
jgi:hypothetical protein